jgi:hypothetical protein
MIGPMVRAIFCNSSELTLTASSLSAWVVRLVNHVAEVIFIGVDAVLETQRTPSDAP